MVPLLRRSSSLSPPCRITNAQPEDAGVYLCTARNEFGQSEALQHTVVIGDSASVQPPTITGPTNTKPGETVS